MQFCPRCGSRNQDDRAACWKCFAQLQKSDSKKAQLILLKDTNAPVGAPIAAALVADEQAVPVAPIPELAEPESPAPMPDLTFDLPPAEPEVFAPAMSEALTPPVAPIGDVMLSSPSFDTADETEDVEQPAPILGLVDLPEDEQEPAIVDLDEPEPVQVEAREVSEESLIVEPADDAASLEGTGEEPLPWWMTQEETEEPATDTEGKQVLDLDNDDLEILPADDTRGIISLDEDEDDDSKES